jgi:hypothetical protein
VTNIDEVRELVERWAHHVDGIDADSGARKITERRVVRFVIRDEVGVLLTNEAGHPLSPPHARRARLFF